MMTLILMVIPFITYHDITGEEKKYSNHIIEAQKSL